MTQDFYNAVKIRFDSLSPKDKEITSLILDNLNKFKSSTIQELADEANSSISTISRLVRKLGFANFQEMKFSFHSLPSSKQEDSVLPAKISPDDSPLDISCSVFHTGINSLQSTQSILRNSNLEKAVAILEKSDQCALFAVGGSAVVALNAYHRFLKSSLHCIHNMDYHMQLIQANRLTKDDCALIVSHTGKNTDMLRIIEVLNENEVPIITITSNILSPIADASDCVLVSISEETTYQPEAMSSMVAQLLLIDALFVVYSVKVDKNSDYYSRARKVIKTTRI